jgi:hypothetical protein
MAPIACKQKLGANSSCHLQEEMVRNLARSTVLKAMLDKVVSF